MGTTFEIRLGEGVPGATEVAFRALDRIEELESQLTVYRLDSEVSRINATAHLAPVRIEAGLFELLQLAAHLSQETGGRYDVTAGALSLAWGFTRGPKRVPTEQLRLDALAKTGIKHVDLSQEDQTISFTQPGIVLNFGSIGKGYAIDEAAKVVRMHWWPTSALIHGGNSSVFALGSPPGTIGGRWRVALRNPFAPDRPLGELLLRNRGLGTSGAAFQQFRDGDRVYGHIIDPTTGFPHDKGPASVSVLAPTAAEADALSTAFYLMGPEESASVLRSRPDVGAIFVMNGDERRPPRLVLKNVGFDEFDQDPAVHLTVADS